MNQDLERLQNDLFEQYDATIAPIDLTLMIAFEMADAHFFAEKSTMIFRGRFKAVQFLRSLIYNMFELESLTMQTIAIFRIGSI